MEGRPFCESCLGSRPVAATKSVSLADAGATAIPGSVLEVQGLGFRFAQEGPWILKGLSFSLRQNETVLLMGRSGCGKSTLALLLAGLYPEYAGFSEGSVSCPEGEVKGLSPEKRAKAVSLVFQNPDDQFALDTVEGEVNFSLENVSYAGDYGQRVASLLEMVGLAGFERRKVLGLSGGEKQKLSLATALATEPRLLILDEPLANLDWESSLEIAGVLERLAREGMSLLAIDHRPEPWLGWLSRILFLGPDGRAAPSDITPEEARANPGAFEKLGVFGPSKGPRPVLSKTRPEWAQSAVANGDLAIMAENLSLRRGRELIWEGVSFSAQRGTITAIM
ncbi:MAG: energy-coupling factor ABC transporter ATP-binding protein, partial [Deltaproteobacteria bacterium]|nr:energy-coupling factor ABC transporter ATP-binding protein [Deltaproteobacteria bacterium]